MIHSSKKLKRQVCLSMNTHDLKVLNKIVEHAQKVIDYTSSCTNAESFLNDEMRVEACVFNIMQIGELAHSELSDNAKDTITSVPWKKIYGLRNRIVHGYESVSMIVIWEIAVHDMQKLVDEILNYLHSVNQ